MDMTRLSTRCCPLCARKEMEPKEFNFADFNLLATEYVASLTKDPALVAVP